MFPSYFETVFHIHFYLLYLTQTDKASAIKIIHFNTYCPVHLLCHTELFNLVEDGCQTWYRRQERKTKSFGSFSFSNLIWPEIVVHNHWSLITSSLFIHFICIVKITAKTRKLVCQLVIGWRFPCQPITHTKSKIRLHPAISINISEWVSEWVSKEFFASAL